MKIAICGAGFSDDNLLLEKAKNIGREIAKHNHILLSGGCRGYPYAAVRGALLEGGKVIAYSPAKDEEEHKLKYDFPIDSNVEYVFTGLGIPERNISLVKAADATIFISGKIGTLNEFTIAFKEKKIIGVLRSGGITDLIPKIVEICGEYEVIYFDDVKEFFRKV